MRILHVTRENDADRMYGLGRSLAPLIGELERRGHEVRYLYQADLGVAARKWQQAVTARLSPLLGKIWPKAGPVLLHVWLERLNMGRLAARVAARDGYDCVHLHDPWLGWGFWLGSLFTRARHVRWCITQHGFGSYTQATGEEGVPYSSRLLRWHHRLERFILARAGWVVCPTAAARSQLQRDLQLANLPAHWTVIRHPRPTLQALDRRLARQRLGWAEDTFHVLAIGRLAPVKRFSLLLSACLASGRRLHLTILGAGDAASLQQQLQAAGSDKVSLTMLSTPEVGTYLSAADLYVSTSLNESFGLANVEALACACPALCSAVGGVPEATAGGSWLLSGEVEVFAAAIRTLYDDVALRDKWSAIGRQSVTFLPDLMSVASDYEALYRPAT